MESIIKKVNSLLLLYLFLFGACELRHQSHRSSADSGPNPIFTNASEELNYIFMMMAYAVVYEDWQESNKNIPNRGYNIGSVIVNKDNEVISWGRNEKFLRNDGTQHGEVRAIQSFLQGSSDSFLEGCTIYTTLEPCPMCAGMILMTRIERVVYGQSDQHYGGAIDRLQLQGTNQSNERIEYPRNVEIIQSEDSVSKGLNLEYQEYGAKGTTRFLSTDKAKSIFKSGFDAFMNHEAQFKDNQSILVNARIFFHNIP